MANFTFLKDDPQYGSFAGACIDAEAGLDKSPNACIKLVRTALEASIKWVYKKDRKFNKPDEVNLFTLMNEPSFQNSVGKNLIEKLHTCRKMGNLAIHNEKTFNVKEAEQCLSNLFDFVQWIDKTYGKNYRKRTFDSGEIPAEDSTLVKILKGAALVGAGALAAIFINKNNDEH